MGLSKIIEKLHTQVSFLKVVKASQVKLTAILISVKYPKFHLKSFYCKLIINLNTRRPQLLSSYSLSPIQRIMS